MRGWSLRSRLFVLIVLPLIFIAGIAAVVRFVLAERMSERLYDNALLTTALAISRDIVLSEGDVLAETLLDSLSTSLGDPVYYRVVGPGGRFVTGYSDAPPRPEGRTVEKGIPAFYDAMFFDTPVRVVVLEEFIAEPSFGGWVTVEVWQTVRQRERLSLTLVYESLGIMGVVLGAAGLLVWFGIRRGLRPLTDLQDAVELRSPDDLGPIRRVLPEELRSLVDAMNTLFARLDRAFSVRDAFIADAAHQLRNPVAAIQAQAESLSTASDPEDLRQRIAALSDTARTAGRLTAQLLTLEKLRGGLSAHRRIEIDIAEIARRATARAAETDAGGDVELEFEATGETPALLGDPVLIEEALQNLIDNAVRYGAADGGHVTVSVDCAEDAAVIRVADRGPGIPPEYRKRIFDRFFRADEQAAEGSGLGLAIARSIAEIHGGSLDLAEAEVGSVFAFRLPTAPAA